MKAILTALSVSILASLAFIVAYFAAGAQTQPEGILLGGSLASLCFALLWWSKRLLPPNAVVEEREKLASPSSERAEAVDALEQGARQALPRRGWLSGLLLGALAFLGAAALTPFRSLGPAPERKLFGTAWKRGKRLVREDGTPVRRDDLEVGSFLTVFPEGSTGPAGAQAMANSATLLIRVEPDFLRLPEERMAWAPDGLVAYSKVCTHAGCPVGLYRRSTHQLLCPCHQSTFDVLTGAVPVFGPASRPLPQLPLVVSADGYVRALDDFPEAIGPMFWERT